MLYNTIFTRRAVRKFDLTPLESSTLSDIEKFITDIKQLDGQNVRLKISSINDVKGGSAPHYILAFCENNDSAYSNVGYVLEKVDLYIQSIGLGSVWLGMAKPNKKENDYCIMLAFGRTDVPIRNGSQDFNRLAIDEISNSDNCIAAVARLAPSAVNTQPWKLHFEDGKVTVKYFGRGMMKLILKKKLNKIDMGIITRFIEVTLDQEKKEIISIMPKTAEKCFEIEISYKPSKECFSKKIK